MFLGLRTLLWVEQSNCFGCYSIGKRKKLCLDLRPQNRCMEYWHSIRVSQNLTTKVKVMIRCCIHCTLRLCWDKWKQEKEYLCRFKGWYDITCCLCETSVEMGYLHVLEEWRNRKWHKTCCWANEMELHHHHNRLRKKKSSVTQIEKLLLKKNGILRFPSPLTTNEKKCGIIISKRRESKKGRHVKRNPHFLILSTHELMSRRDKLLSLA